ncbi:MAG TPA: hypothetical protein VGS21_01820, partial [Acidimicrobiales bacterium]|nr:hypothetical protein [Acidimicrobiales bacterium]
SSAAITVHAHLFNPGTSPATTTVTSTITPPAGGGAQPITVSKSFTVAAANTLDATISPTDAPALDIKSPSVWWPYQMGAQPLYGLSTTTSGGSGGNGEGEEGEFGIRTVTTKLEDPSTLAPKGVRLFEVNGRPFVVRGGGWSENLFLHFSSSDLANQIALVKGLGLDVIRTEGKEMPDAFYAAMDRAGIMIDAGFQCCDSWQNPGPYTAAQLAVLTNSATTIGQRLRNHPSVINYSWSDNAPSAKQESVTLAAFKAVGFDDPVISSAEYNSSPILGQSGEKEGPYDWVPPSYWYDTTHSDYSQDSTLTNVGGSWGFDSEQSAGDTVPTLASLQGFMSASDLAELWKDPSFNQYHTDYEPGHVGYQFGTLYNFDRALTARYGAWSSLAQYVEEAQVQNYEDTRAQFEAFLDHSVGQPTPSTGTIYWMLNKGWPTLLWDLYNYDYDEAGSYFGAEKANEALHVLFAVDTHTVTVDNLGAAAASGLTATAKVYDLAGKVLDSETSGALTVAGGGVATRVLSPRVPAPTTPPTAAETYFVELTLSEGGKVVDRNVYWLSTQADVVDWPKTEGNPQATMTRYGDLRGLAGLQAAAVTASATTTSLTSPAGYDETTVTLSVPAGGKALGFFLRSEIAGAPLGVAPVIWSDNDITLWPGESQTITATYPASLLPPGGPAVTISGWNVAPFTVGAPQGIHPQGILRIPVQGIVGSLRRMG